MLVSLASGGCAWTRELPLVLLPPSHAGPAPLVVLLSGDGDWSEFTGGLAEALHRRGFPVVGLRSRAYTLTGSTPEGAARDLEQAVRHYLWRWHRQRLVLIGYSRGADLIPFVFNRWPADLRQRVDQAVLIGVHEWAGFRFHLLDLLFEVRRPGDLAVRPELAGMSAVPQTCVLGTREHQSLCTRPLPCMQVLSYEGGHLITRGTALITKLVALVQASGRAPRQQGCLEQLGRRVVLKQPGSGLVTGGHHDGRPRNWLERELTLRPGLGDHAAGSPARGSSPGVQEVIVSATSPAAVRAIGQGRFFWYELGTPDLLASTAFYTAALGWRAEAYPGGSAYTVWKADDAGIGGAFQQPVERPQWVGYVYMEDVDGTMATVPQLGGRQVVPPTDIPGIGRYGVLADPQGAVIAVMRPIGEDRPAQPMKRGHVAWHELNTTDSAAALEFYGRLFGWEPATTMDMGEYGQYRIFRQAGAGEQEWLGGMSDMAKHVGVPAHWLYYVNVDHMEAALQRIAAAGGEVLNGPNDVPGGRAAQCLDPQRGAFAIFAQEPAA